MMSSYSGALTEEFLLDFINKMPVVGDGETICEFGENPHSIFSPAYAMFEADRDHWNVVGYVRVSEVMAHPKWRKAEAVLWSIGLSMPGGIRHDKPGGRSHNASKGPCAFDEEGKRQFLEWVDNFLHNAPDEWTPLEWISHAKERGGAGFAKQAMVTSVQLRALWGEPLDEDWCCGSVDRRGECESAKAEALEFDKSFSDVDWHAFVELLYARPIKVLAASLGINPDHPCADIKWSMEFKKYATGDAASRLKRFEERYFVLMKSISHHGGRVQATKLRENGPQVIEIKGFAEFAERQGWDLPDQFPGRSTASEADNSSAENTPTTTGKTGRTSIVKAAIEIATEYKKSLDRDAGPTFVMDKLEEYAKSGEKYSDFLVHKDGREGVWWRVSGKAEPIEWKYHSCQAALKRWRDGVF